ncbi:hypothetical protein C4D60_Mb04t08350 [Musa balbisiana]|uniref:Uncharacterized protein n=1 Tax=Musa balbisiana TaxID=52838 RepID=A0A4S8KAI0_MUSBA|nr:hypothetical protein C4D60_Mb04t08350 [Musa balbisiana]
MFIDGDGEGAVQEEGGIQEDWSKSGDEKGRRMALRPLSARATFSLCSGKGPDTLRILLNRAWNVVRKFSPLSIIACNIRIDIRVEMVANAEPVAQ